MAAQSKHDLVQSSVILHDLTGFDKNCLLLKWSYTHVQPQYYMILHDIMWSRMISWDLTGHYQSSEVLRCNSIEWLIGMAAESGCNFIFWVLFSSQSLFPLGLI